VRRIGLFGNPNCGKTTLFNSLTGLRQRTGNFPGVTVDKKTGVFDVGHQSFSVVDFPGTYSLYPDSKDERVVLKGLLSETTALDLIVFVADVNQLERHLLLFSQLKDCGIPVILVLNMIDLLEDNGIEVDAKYLRKALQCPVCTVSSRTGEGIDQLKSLLLDEGTFELQSKDSFNISAELKKFKAELSPVWDALPDYLFFQVFHNSEWLVKADQQAAFDALKQEMAYHPLDSQLEDTMSRCATFEPIVERAMNRVAKSRLQEITTRLDRILLNPVFGPLIFVVLMLFVFQAIYAWASYPMDLIDSAVGQLSAYVSTSLPDHWTTSLLTDGVIAGVGGVIIFIPQIAILFLLIAVLEEIGYLSRVAFMFDRLMQFFGLNGRSLVSMVSSAACAIPAVMSSRTIPDWKERMITIMVAPLISCSARIPVYALLVGFVVPSEQVWGIINLQGLAFGGLYFLGILGALLSALAMKYIVKSDSKSYFLLEMPEYKRPDFKNAFYVVLEKVRTFVWEAGKIIFIISIVLWGLSSYGPKDKMAQVEQEVSVLVQEQDLSDAEAEYLLSSKKLEVSYIGHMGKFIEPVIEPLGFDWKIGIALITSFAAREVFVGTMATLFAVESGDDDSSLRQQMEQSKHPKTGLPLFSTATALSLLLFYVFAMQCMSTLAVVYRETKSWKWPISQFLFMTALAYLSSLFAYHLLS
jgi:ferrous iron transport protein B